MAGDILLYQTDKVPIGDDQRQHLELARDVAERFNARYGETFRLPEGIFPEVGARIMDLQEPDRKMSTTGGTPQGTVGMLDPPEAIAKKFRSAVTDSGRDVVHDPEEKPGVSNLIEILHVATGEPIADDRGALRRSGLRRVQAGRRRGGRRAARADPAALRGAARRRGRAAAAAGAGRREGARGVGADAERDVRADGLRRGLRLALREVRRCAEAQLDLVVGELAPLARRRARRASGRRSGCGAGGGPGGRPPRACA